MLNLANIEKYYPANERSFKKNILREYLQYKILEIIFNSKIGQSLAFLGGTNLRVVYNNNRFSEDLDFDNFGISEEDFTALSFEVKRGLELQGYEVEIKNVFKGAFRSYIRMPKVLFDNNMASMQEEKILIQLDTAPHDFQYKPDKVIINKFDVFTQIFVTPLDILLSQKIYTIFNRKRAKGRDFFDTIFLFGLAKPNYDYLKLKIGVDNWLDTKEKLLLELKKMDLELLAKDVEPFLFNPSDSKKVMLFSEYLKQF